MRTICHIPRRLLLGVAGLGCLVLVTALWASNRPVPDGTMELARHGVTSNSDWDPIARRLDHLDFALVPAGCFSMGSTEAQLEIAVESCKRFFGGKCQVDFTASETPAHMVCFDQPFWIQKTEVSNRLYGSSSSVDMRKDPSWPRDSVTWYQASDFCQRHNARLPSEEEWEYAARGPDGLIFPWGNDFELEKVISGRLVPTGVGSIPSGSSWVGALDMSGSIAEWVEQPYHSYDSSETGTGDTGVSGKRVIRGGSWFSFSAFLLRSANREIAAPTTANSTIGFRCARNVD